MQFNPGSMKVWENFMSNIPTLVGPMEISSLQTRVLCETEKKNWVGKTLSFLLLIESITHSFDEVHMCIMSMMWIVYGCKTDPTRWKFIGDERSSWIKFSCCFKVKDVSSMKYHLVFYFIHEKTNQKLFCPRNFI
jgi:hypothetical protein